MARTASEQASKCLSGTFVSYDASLKIHTRSPYGSDIPCGEVQTNPLMTAQDQENLPSPVTHLATFETCSRVAAILCSSSTSMRDFNTYLISHEVTLVVLGDTLFCSFACIEFLSEASRSGQNYAEVEFT